MVLCLLTFCLKCILAAEYTYFKVIENVKKFLRKFVEKIIKQIISKTENCLMEFFLFISLHNKRK